jgi:hypothetical protein
MTPDPYRIAFETALSELTEITTILEQLRTRRGHVQNLIATLQPYFASETGQAEMTTAPMISAPQPNENLAQDAATPAETSEEFEPATEYSYLTVPAPLPEGDGDAFQRRVRTTFRFKGLATQR